MGNGAESKRRAARPGLHSKPCGLLPPSAQEPVPFLHKGCSPGDQVSRAPTPGGLIQRAQSRRLGRQPRRGTQGAGSRGRMSAGPGTAPACPSPCAALGGGSWHPLALDTADLGWRKQRPAPAWPEGQCSQNSFPLKGRGQARPSTPGRQPTALPSTPPEQLCQKDSQI